MSILLALIFAVHLVAVNLAAAGPLPAIWLEWRATRDRDESAGAASRYLARASMIGLVVGVLLGAGMLAIVWYGASEGGTTENSGDTRYTQTIDRLPALRWWYLIGEIAFYFACMGPYLWYWQRASRWRRRHRLLAILAATNLLYHFPPLFASLSVMGTRSELADRPFDRAMYLQLMLDPEVISRVLHHWLAAAAIAGATLMIYAVRKSIASRRLAASGATVALIATLLQLPVGLWVLFQAPSIAQERLLGSDWLTTALFGTSITASVLLIQSLGAIALGGRTEFSEIDERQIDDMRRDCRRAIALLLLVIALMTGAMTRMN